MKKIVAQVLQGHENPLDPLKVSFFLSFFQHNSKFKLNKVEASLHFPLLIEMGAGVDLHFAIQTSLD